MRFPAAPPAAALPRALSPVLSTALSTVLSVALLALQATGAPAAFAVRASAPGCAGQGSATPGGTSAGASSDAPGGDVDGDGVDDVAVGDPFAGPGGQAGAGAVHVLFDRGERATVLRAPRPEAGDGFGWSVRLAHLDADRCADLLIGAPYADVDGVRDAGAVYVVYGGARGEPVRLVSPTPQAGAHFGWSVASAGALVAVGAPYEDDGGVRDAGAVYLFTAGTPGAGRRISQEDEGVTGNSETGDMFGWSVAMGEMGGTSGEPDLAIGAPYENDDGVGRQDGAGTLDSGSIAVLFDVRGSTGAYVSKKWDLHDVVETEAGDRFGYAMAYARQGDTAYLAVSAPLGDGGRVKDAGFVRLFQASGTEELTPVATFEPGSQGVAGGGYGFSLALTGEGGEARLAVGTPFGGTDGRGGVWLVPVRNPAGARLIEQGEAGDHFGWSVTFSGNRLVAGLPDHGVSGAVALIGRNDGTGTLLAPATGGVPAVDGGTSADFGAAAG